MKDGLHKKIEDTLNCLDGMERAEANPFLYGKIWNRLEEVKGFVPKQLAWRMVIALAVVTLVNVVSIVHFTSEKTNTGVELVAKEYSIDLPQTY